LPLEAPMNLIDFVPQYSKMLQNIDRWLEKAIEHATAKKFDVETLLQARLAPDQFALDRQIQSACDSAKFSAAYLSGKEAPAHPDTEKTIAELRARIQSCRAYLETIQPSDLAGGEARKVSAKWMQGKWISGEQHLVQMALPNFYFHVTTAYAILRHNGVDLGKKDFMGNVPLND
jgi:hypothetical protein